MTPDSGNLDLTQKEIKEPLVARLSPIKAYCGTVEYVIDKKVKGTGDMTLVKDVSFHP